MVKSYLETVPFAVAEEAIQGRIEVVCYQVDITKEVHEYKVLSGD